MNDRTFHEHMMRVVKRVRTGGGVKFIIFKQNYFLKKPIYANTYMYYHAPFFKKKLHVTGSCSVFDFQGFCKITSRFFHLIAIIVNYIHVIVHCMYCITA